MPGDPLGVAGEFGAQVAVAQDHRVAQQVRDDVDDATVGHDVLDAPAALVPGDHLVSVPPLPGLDDRSPYCRHAGERSEGALASGPLRVGRRRW